MNYGTVLMLVNQSNVLTFYEIPSSFTTSVPPFEGNQFTGQQIGVIENVTLTSGEVALIHEYGVSGFSTQNFICQQVNVPGIITYSNSTTVYYSPTTTYVKSDPGYQIQFVPWFGIQNHFINIMESTYWKVPPYFKNGQLIINSSFYSISVTVFNNQSIATPAPFDQLLNITETQVASALGST